MSRTRAKPGRIERWLTFVETAWDVIAAVAMCTTMLVGVADVAGRYLFNAPLSWAFDLISWYLMPAIFFFSLASTLRRNEHVNVDLICRRLRPRTQNILLAIGAALTTVVFALIFYRGIVRAGAAWVTGEVIAGGIPWPTWVFTAFVPLGTGVLLMRLLGQMTRAAVAAARNEPPIDRPSDVEGEGERF